MNREKILTILGKVIDKTTEELLNLPNDTTLPDIGLASLTLIQFIVDLEEEFGFEVLDSDLLLSNFQTVDMLFITIDKYFHTDSLKKVLVCDCDNCLWSGIAGEETTYINEAAASLQRELIQLYENGVLLCLCSKNEPSNIANAFTQPDMILKPEHILLSKINWNNKAENLRKIADELKLSVDCFVFLDDSDYELELINALLPEVTTLQVDFSNIENVLASIRSCFALNTSVSNRTEQYRQQKEREKAKLKYNSVEEYNASLETTVICEKASANQADRIAELSNRTNQCNLSDTRYTTENIQLLLNDPDYTLLSLSVKDKYGDMGIVGAAVIHVPAVIEAFFFSCRAFDRGFEEILIQRIKEFFPSNLMGIYRETEQNRRYSNFYPQHGVILYER